MRIAETDPAVLQPDPGGFHVLAAHRCPCGAVVSGIVNAPEDRPPTSAEDLFGTCGRCGAFLVLNRVRGVRRPTAAELDEQLRDPTIHRAVIKRILAAAAARRCGR